MPVTTSQRPHGATQPRSVSPPRDGRYAHAVEGAVAGLCAVLAMVVVSALALTLLDAGSVGSVAALTAAVAALAVGGSLTAGPDASGATESSGSGLAGLFGGGGGMSPAMNGSADVVPLGVTLVGAVVLWLLFSRRLRHQRFDAGELAVRAAGTGAAALFALMILAALAKGTITLPASVTNRGESGGGAGGGGLAGGGGMLGRLLGGGGGAASEPTLAYHASVGSAAFGALLWVAVVLGVGCVVSRRVRVPLGGAVDRFRSGWAPALGAVVRMILIVGVVALLVVGFVGLMAGGRGATAAGAALLVAPNAVAAFLSLGVGAPWTESTEQVKSDGGNPLAGLMSTLGGGQRPVEPDRHEQLRAVSVAGWPLWLIALVVTGLALVVCAYTATRNADPRHMRPLHPYRGPLAAHVGLAERFGLVTAAVFGVACVLAEASGRFGASMFGSEMGGTRARFDGSLPMTLAGGLIAGFVAGMAGSLLYRAMTSGPRILPRKPPLEVPVDLR
ncbi:streptophobe family protein [Streptomyces sp. NPDC004539]|uniref:streptophobe family protein n=1 Tax=Streptomyces sp. NPDC004539 TaxID=3154280 RepID=UPI0033BC5F3D